MNEEDITLSTIGVGLDVDAGLLRWLAEAGGGRFYSTDRARDIPRILTDETRLAARHAIIEEATAALVVGSSPVLRSTGGEFPRLDGYVVTLPKNTGHVVLVSPRGDPLLAQWQFGLGRTIAWTSDSEGRWTAALNTWRGASVFWSALGGLDPPARGGGVPAGGRCEGRCGFITRRGRSTGGRKAFGTHRRAAAGANGDPVGGHGAGTFRSGISSQRAGFVHGTDRRGDIRGGTALHYRGSGSTLLA